ncbi:phage tail protein [Serratia ficaria]|uniref:phage tail protein n=1 Tax=Serratia ficaria TaxID=61651 RepID=UPI002178351E|nr:phage tail protein [Serratia ficaria]CAI1147448.1 Phage tail fibre repeat [Serratia ficaria]CAI2007067.1 Phage tail fibre repeat [Serratia ficaria]CAI2517643.1 Phage tail fibre repeat [Serratia ficaria]
MNDKKFSTVITAIGAARLAEAASGGAPLVIKQMGVGDGGGALPVPDPSQTGLINETYRAALNKLSVSDQSDSIIEAEMIMPPTTGGYWLREVALFADDGACIAVGNMPPTYKPLLSEGSGRFQIIRVLIEVSSAADVSLIADPSIVLATVESVQAAADGMKDYADRQLGQHEQSRNHPDATLAEKGFTQLSNATDSDSENMAATPAAIKAAIAAAVREGWELSHPKGISLFFFENVDPNQLWPWSTWEYTGEDRTVRIAKRDGSNVGQFGGSDTAVLGKNNLPNVQLNLAGRTGDTDLGLRQTSANGGHTHPGKYTESNTSLDGGRSDRRSWSVNYGQNEEGLIGAAPDHEHSVYIGPHGHDFSGKTEALGSGEAISIVENHVLQMCWHRVA